MTLSHLPDETLSRYFSLQTAGLADICDRPVVTENTGHLNLLNALIDDLFRIYGRYADGSVAAPAIRKAERSGLLLQHIILWQPAKNDPVSNWLKGFLSRMECEVLSFGQLDYLQELSLYIRANLPCESQLVRHLISINFNHLEVFGILCTSFAEMSSDQLHRQLADAGQVPLKTIAGYDSTWMPLKDMLCGWLKEQMSLDDRVAAAGRPLRKLFIDLPVAHLACLLRLFHESKLLGTGTLADLFRQVCGHISTKRQPSVSEGSLSKEFYGVSQQTAARVKGTLEQMITLIDQKYFP
ncbi:hypothetical protein D0C36_15965 [Mucilaginibacter conchicola]|uniref:Uncharacterized protein n=2 Tax=Mucilaginibacter conchicola TaxID=2303333 RepID=A0A372NUI1_9SPHI|nr:hypothetical protein D0C36_15965 [Mucilaginibacter conchicola]